MLCHSKPNPLTVSENAQIRFILRFILLFFQKTPIAAKCFHETANPLFDVRYPFTLQAKPSINIKNSIDNGNFDYSESSKILYKESDIEQTP